LQSVNQFTDIRYKSLDEESVCRKPLTTQDNTKAEKHIYTSTFQAQFRPITLATKQQKTVRALDCATTAISNKQHTFIVASGIMLYALMK
jgi:hypothetical protein